jgi:peptide/nickel transport system permease protein
MGAYIIRRSLAAIPTILVISFVIFLLLDLAPGDPTSSLPLSIPVETRLMIRESLGMDDPMLLRYAKWLRQFFVVEPLNVVQDVTGVTIPWLEGQIRLTSWSTRGMPVVDLIRQRLPQTLWVVGISYGLAVLIAVPLGVFAAYKQNSFFDQASSVFAVIGFSLPTFFTGLLAILVFGVWLKWFPTIYDTTLRVNSWATLMEQIRQMFLPVAVLTFFQLASLSRFTRSAAIENLRQDYVRTARSKGLSERLVVARHVVRNSLIPVVTLVALGIPAIFGGAIITEQIFRVNGLGALLISAIQSSDIPVVQTCLVIFAILVVFFNLVADVVYGFLDPRIRYG